MVGQPKNLISAMHFDKLIPYTPFFLRLEDELFEKRSVFWFFLPFGSNALDQRVRAQEITRDTQIRSMHEMGEMK